MAANKKNLTLYIGYHAMGQTVSLSSDGMHVFLSMFASESDELAQVLLCDTGLALEDVTPEPGWFGYSTAYGVVLRFRPHLVNTGIATYSDTLIATLSRPVASGAAAVLYSRDDAPWDGNQRTDTPWVQTVFETQPDDELTVSLPQFALQATNVPRLFRAQAFNHGGGSPVWEAEPSDLVAAEADGTVVKAAGATFDETELDVEVTAQHGSQSYTACGVVSMVEPVRLDAPPQISINPFERVPLGAEHFEYPEEVAAMGGEPITHVAFELPSNLYIEHAGIEYEGYATFSASDLPALRLRQRVFRSLRSSVHLAILFWVSFDRGLSFVAFSSVAVTAFPCFELDARVCVGTRGGRRRWQLITTLQPGQTVLCERDAPRTVKSVLITSPMTAQMVSIAKHGLCRGSPNRTLLVTSNHHVKLRPDGASIPAGRLPDLFSPRRVARVCKSGVQLCHLELDQYAFPLVNNVLCESHLKKGGRPTKPKPKTGYGPALLSKHQDRIKQFRRRQQISRAARGASNRHRARYSRCSRVALGSRGLRIRGRSGLNFF